MATASGPDQDFLREAADMGSERVASYTRYQDYYDGHHKTKLTERERRYLEASGLEFAENFCETIVDVMCERLSVVGFKVGDKEALAEHGDDSWKRNRMDDKQATVHNQTAVKGDSFVIVDIDANRRARYTWNPSERVKCCYSDDSDEMEYAVKVWNTSATSFVNPRGQHITRMNLYWPDRIERYFTLASTDETQTNTWMRYVELDDEFQLPLGWPIPWVDAAGEPLGIPVIHFKNKPRGSRYGRSDVRGIIPQQDGLNKMVLDLFNVQDQQGWPQRFATGINSDTNLTVAIGEYLSTTAENAKFGQFDAADPRPTLEAIASTLQRMAAQSRTPLHLLMMGGSLPSGETLKTAEAPLVKKIEDRQVTLGSAWEDMVAMGFKLEQTFGQLPQDFVPDEDVIEAQWDDPQSRNETAFLGDLETKLRIGVAKDTVLREAGYDPDEERELRQVDEEEEMAREEQAIRSMAAGLDSSSKEAYNG